MVEVDCQSRRGVFFGRWIVSHRGVGGGLGDGLVRERYGDGWCARDDSGQEGTGRRRL